MKFKDLKELFDLQNRVLELKKNDDLTAETLADVFDNILAIVERQGKV